MESEDEEERLWLVKEIMRKTLQRDENERGGREEGEDGRWVLIVKLKKTIKRRC